MVAVTSASGNLAGRSVPIVLVSLVLAWAMQSPDALAEEPTGADDRQQVDAVDLDEEFSLLEESTVVTATKLEEKAEEAPAIIEVISAQDIRRRGYRTVGEALRGLAGIAIIDDHTYWNVGVRGLYSESGAASDILKVMINGQPVSFRSNSVNFFGHELLPVEAVKRIEVIRGPGSALYGANAFLGVVNVVTFEGDELGEGMSNHSVSLDGMYLENEHHHGFNGGGAFASRARFAEFGYFLSGTYSYVDRSGLDVPGYADMVRERFHRLNPDLYPVEVGFPSPAWDAPAREKMLRSSPSRNDLERVGSLYATTYYDPTGTQRVGLDASFQYFDRFNEFLDFSYLTHRSRLTYLNWFVRGRYQLTPVDLRGLSITASLALAGGEPTDDEHLVDPMTPGSRMRRLFGYQALDVAIEASYAFSQDHVVSLGVDYTNDREDLLTVEVTNDATGGTYREEGFGEKTFVNLGVYAQWIWRPLKGLGLTLGTRLDHNNIVACSLDEWDCFLERDDVPEQEGSHGGTFQLSNRAALVYLNPDWGFYAKAIYGSSFKPPSPFQLYHNRINIAGSTGNPNLRPQTADTIEVLAGLRPLDGLDVNVTFFYTFVHDKVVAFKEQGLVAGRNADVDLHGIESTVRYQWREEFEAYANLSLLISTSIRPKQKSGETDAVWARSAFNDEIPVGMYPTLQAGFGLNLLLTEYHLNANLELRYVGERRASLINNQLFNIVDMKKTYTLEDYALLSLTLSSVGLQFWGDRETVVSVGFRHVPGSFVEPGFGGIDVPGLGPQVVFRVQQQF